MWFLRSSGAGEPTYSISPQLIEPLLCVGCSRSYYYARGHSSPPRFKEEGTGFRETHNCGKFTSLIKGKAWVQIQVFLMPRTVSVTTKLDNVPEFYCTRPSHSFDLLDSSSEPTAPSRVFSPREAFNQRMVTIMATSATASAGHLPYSI